MSDTGTERATIWMSDELMTQIKKGEIDGTTNMSKWMRRAARDRMLIEELCKEAGVELPDGDREREAVLADLITSGSGSK